jgi:4-amino-4-deoxy-L-arabinose transferase-like glycosyltransferase
MNAQTDRAERFLLLFLLIAGFLARLYSTIYHTCLTNPDIGIHALMVKHIAEGRHYPVFFYGQAYMGTLESYVAAFFYRLLGHSLFPPLIGSAFFSIIALPCFYFWARNLFGVRAALFGLALLVIGPPYLFYMNIFHGYPIMLFTGLAACGLTVCILTRGCTTPDRPLWRNFLLLGVAVGLGWWNNGLIAAFVIPCALMLVLFMPRKRFFTNTSAGLLGFGIGAAPWLLYTLTRPDALDFATDVTASPTGGLAANLGVALRMLPSLFDMNQPREHLLGLAVLVFFITLIALSMLKRTKDTKSYGKWLSLGLRLMPWMIIATNLALCAISARFAHVPAHRYLLPVIPAFFALAGEGFDRLSRFFPRHPFLAGVIPLAVMMGWQFSRLPSYWDSKHRAAVSKTDRYIEALTTFVEVNGIDAMNSKFFDHWKNFASCEKLNLASYPHFDRYRPYRQAMATATNLAVINNHFDVSRFLSRTKGEAKSTNIAGVLLHWDIQRAPIPFKYVDQNLVDQMEWEDGGNVAGLMDSNLDTPLGYGQLAREAPSSVERVLRVRFRKPLHIVGLHSWGPSGTWESIRRLSARNAEGKWVVLCDEDGGTGWFWSGTHPHLQGYLAHFEMTFPPTLTDELKITVWTSEEGIPLVSELWFMEDAASEKVQHEDTDISVLAEILRSRDAGTVYASRRVSELLHRHEPEIHTIIPRGYYDQYDGFDRHEYPTLPVALKRNDILLTPEPAAERSATVLSLQGFTFESEPLGSWVLFQIKEEAPGPELMIPGMYWTEYGCFLSVNPFALEAQPEGKFIPFLSEPVRYRNGAILIGVEVDSVNPACGSTLHFTYSWRCPPGVNPNRWAMFVHFIHDGEVQFQDDHVWLQRISSEALRHQPDAWVFTEGRTVKVPDDAPPGSYTVRMGLYDRRSGKRLDPNGNVRILSKAIYVEDALHIIKE